MGSKNQTHCKHGHKFTIENTKYYGGTRNCYECHKIKARNRYHNNKKYRLDTIKRASKRQIDKREECLVYKHKSKKNAKDRFREIILAAKACPCMDCNIQYPYYVMEFDHIRGKKIFNISQAYTKCSDDQKLLDEIAKCDVVCANYHRERTFSRLVYK